MTSTIIFSAIAIVSLFAFVVVVLITCYFTYRQFKNVESPQSEFFTKLCLGHRGATKNELPFSENTMSAFRYCYEQGGDGVELDVNFTSDHKLAIFHDIQTVLRVMQSKGRSKIGDLSLKEARDDCTFLKGKKDTIPTLDEVVEKVEEYNRTRGFKIMIELKEWKFLQSINMAYKVAKLFQKHPFLYEASVVGSFNPMILYFIRRVDPKIVTNMLFCRSIFGHYLSNEAKDFPDISLIKNFRRGELPVLARVGIRMISPLVNLMYNYSMLTWVPSFLGAGFVGMSRMESMENGCKTMNLFKNRGYHVNIWGINSKVEKVKLMKEGVTVTTDYNFE